jgi:hypothetical protein
MSTDRYAFINGVILDGTENMVPLKDRVLLVKGDRIEDIRPAGTRIISGYEKVDLQRDSILCPASSTCMSTLPATENLRKSSATTQHW